MKKDIEWLKEEMECMHKIRNTDLHSDTWFISKDAILEALNQLDESERPIELQELIDKYSKDSMSTYDVKVEREKIVNDLQNLLVPKQEITFEQAYDKLREESILSEKSFDYYWNCINDNVEIGEPGNLLVPKQEEITHKQVEKYLLDRNIRVIDIDVYEKMQSDLAEFENKIVIEKPIIPQFVANYIKWFKNDFEHNFAADIDFIISLIQVSHKFSRREKIKKWISKSGNAQKLIDAYRWGYEVEEEQKYIVRLPSSMQDSFPIVALGRINKGNLSVRKNRVGTNLILHDKYLLTEQEIKDYDPRYMTFAKPVEELEE